MTENEIGTIVLEAAITVHQELGPGLLESVYEAVLAAYRMQTRLLAEFWRGIDEIADYPVCQWL